MNDRTNCYNMRGELITHFTQWDYGWTIAFRTPFEEEVIYVDFCNKNSSEAERVIPTSLGDQKYTSVVPNEMFLEATPVFIYVVVKNNDDSITTELYTTIPVREKTKPHDYEFKENVEVVSLIALSDEMKALMELFTDQENERISNEDERVANEKERQSNEQERQANETQRQANEEERIANENQRVADHEKCQEATDAANAAADNANTAADNANEAIQGIIDEEEKDISGWYAGFTEADVLELIESDETISTLFGKILKFMDSPIKEEWIDYTFFDRADEGTLYFYKTEATQSGSTVTVTLDSDKSYMDGTSLVVPDYFWILPEVNS